MVGVSGTMPTAHEGTCQHQTALEEEPPLRLKEAETLPVALLKHRSHAIKILHCTLETALSSAGLHHAEPDTMSWLTPSTASKSRPSILADSNPAAIDCHDMVPRGAS